MSDTSISKNLDIEIEEVRSESRDYLAARFNYSADKFRLCVETFNQYVSLQTEPENLEHLSILDHYSNVREAYIKNVSILRQIHKFKTYFDERTPAEQKIDLKAQLTVAYGYSPFKPLPDFNDIDLNNILSDLEADFRKLDFYSTADIFLKKVNKIIAQKSK